MPCVPDLKCGDGWKGAYGDFGTFCYKEVYEHKTWDEAHGACKQFGGELFSVKNAYEQRFLENFTNIESWIGYRYRWARDMCVSAWQIYLYQVDEGGGGSKSLPRAKFALSDTTVSVFYGVFSLFYLFHPLSCRQSLHFFKHLYCEMV